MFKGLLKRIGGELSRRNIPYMIIGGQAVLLYGEPRLTKDIDVTLGIGIEGMDRIRDAAAALSLRVLVPDAEDFVGRTMVLPVIDDAAGIRVDFIFSFSPYEQQALERARDVLIDGVPVRFASLEDLVIHKMIAGRPRDLEDIATVLLKNPGYDRAYIRTWLEEFDRALDAHYQREFQMVLDSLAK